MNWFNALMLIARAAAFILADYNFDFSRALAVGGVVCAITIFENTSRSSPRSRWPKPVWLGSAWALSLAVFGAFLADGLRLLSFDFASAGFLIGVAVWPIPADCRTRPMAAWFLSLRPGTRDLIGCSAGQNYTKATIQPRFSAFQRLLSVAWVLFTAAELVRGAYICNKAPVFWTGIAGLFAAIAMLTLGFEMPRLLKQALIVALLLLAGLPITNGFIRQVPDIHDPVLDFSKYYSYEGAKKDPDASVAWAHYSIRKWWEFEKKAFLHDGPSELVMRFRPNLRSKLYDSDIAINSLGFRGREFSREKVNTYRVIALGESTTFGVTLTPDHRPWPELLEELVQKRLKTRKPVEIINAGFPGRTLPQNIYRLKHELLAFQPDLIISYHGHNGFYMLDNALPPVSGEHPPGYLRRPARLLAALEYNLKLAIYKRRNRMTSPDSPEPKFSNVMQTAYAESYRELIQITRTNHIKLVLANYSMAVNPRSDPELIEFYRHPFPAVYARIKANEAHSSIVEALAKENPDVTLVDTHPRLDGNHQYFIDLMHFSKEGEEQMAECFFEAIKPIIEHDMSH